MPNMPLAIRTVGLGKMYGELAAVDSLDLDVAAGSVTALLGGNGAGKTTTLSMLLGLLQPTAGNIEILGVDLLSHREDVAQHVNFSSPYVDLPNRLTVRQNLTVYGHLYDVRNLKKRVEELAEKLRLTALLDRPYGDLSAGQKTRVSLAKAVLNKPRVLLLDEPTASLDPDAADWVRQMLLDYRKESGATIFMSSHNMYEVERMCDDVIVMKKGRIVARGSPRALLESYGRENLEEVFLDIARDRAAAMA